VRAAKVGAAEARQARVHRSVMKLAPCSLLLLPSIAHADVTGPWSHASLTASSQLDDDHAVEAVLDPDDGAWCAKKGSGVGESLTITFDQPTALGTLRFNTAMWRHGKRVKGWNKPTSLIVTVDGVATTVSVDARDDATLAVDKAATTVQVAFAAAKKGKKKASCISRLGLFGPDGFDHVLFGDDPHAADGFAADVAALGDAFRICDETALAKVPSLPRGEEVTSEGTTGYRFYDTIEEMAADRCALLDTWGDDHPMASCTRHGDDEIECKPAEAASDMVLTRWQFTYGKDHHWRLEIERTELFGE
jgi:hypothetical protein